MNMVEHCLRLVWLLWHKTFIWTSTFSTKQRDKIRYWLFAFVMFLFVVLILQNAISEYFFFGMNGVKYNFSSQLFSLHQ
jgi:hypothetical protein